ncbi:MAG TPA: GWxTD domain-containing protein [Candidatus Deferrimicrobium sp.]|nr:GWxTD domain-containing protein [Candidatus Deferrimicrobium sp.]
MMKKIIKPIFTTFLVVFWAVTLNISLNAANNMPAQEKSNSETTINIIANQVNVKDLDQPYRDWLDLVYYIISPIEKETFLKLTNNRERDAFINLFWKLRDPTAGTPENEFREEHIKRFQHANRYFKYGTPLPGWKTDRGKIYILLGPPVSENEILNKSDIYPVLIWDYYGGVEKGLPTSFNIVFYKRSGSGDYVLYIPTVDGPASLLISNIAQVDHNDFASIYEKIHESEPAVANICLSLIPGEDSSGFSPSLQSNLLISQIYELPKKNLNVSYAKNFLNYKGMVETSVITDYINLKTDLYILKEPVLDMNFVHFALRPERISVDYDSEIDKYYFNYNLIVVLKKGEDVVMEYNKNFPFYYTKNELAEKISDGVILTDYFPISEGNFKLAVVLQNSINKEVGYYEQNIDSTTLGASPARIYGPIISYQAAPADKKAGFAAFTIMGTSIKIDPQRTFGFDESLFTTFYVDLGAGKIKAHAEMEVTSQDENRPYRKTYSYELPEGEKYYTFTQNLEKLKYGNYQVKTTLMGEGNTIIDVQEKDFMVSPMATISHPPLASKLLKSENHFLFYMMLANQYENVKNIAKAGEYYEKALALNASYPQLVKAYAAFLMNREKYDRLLIIVENLKGQEKEAFDYHTLKGKVFYYLQRYDEAVRELLEANKIYDSDVSVLNTLGFCFIRLGNIEEARRVLSASLVVNQEQEDIVEILGRLNNGKKKNS